jgi:hypothetical protein
MKSPEQVVAELERWLAKRWQRAVLTPTEDWPHRMALGTPSGAALEANFPAVLDGTHRWQDWAAAHQVVLDVIRRKVFGTIQQLPTHLVLPDFDTAVRLLGGTWPSLVAAARARASATAARFPQADLAPLMRELTELPDVDFNLLLVSAKWFRAHDAAGLTPRQVPIEGLDSKWLNTKQHLIGALSGKDELGLVRRPRTVHLTYLDPQHLHGGGRRYDSATENDTATPCYLPQTLVITENKDTALFFLPLERGIALQGGGLAGPATIPTLSWVTGCGNIIYWGDLDAEGFEIINQYRSRGLDVRTVLMDNDTLDEYSRFGVTHDRQGRSLLRGRKTLPLLTPNERSAYHTLTDPQWHGPRRVEQERIPLDVAHAAVLDPGRRT